MAAERPATAARPHLLQRLGCGHRGFRIGNPAAAWVGLLLILLLPILFDVVGALRFGMQQGYVDLRIWRDVGRGYLADPSVPLYQTYPSYLYPPFFITLIGPLFALPDPWAAAVFQLLKWGALIASLRLAWRLASPGGEDLPLIVTLGSLLLAWRFLANSMSCGNVNMFMLAAMLAGAWLVQRGRHAAGGFVVGVAACVKVMPGLLLLYFLYKGWWRTAVGAILAAAVCLFIYPSLIIGWENNLAQLAGWWEYLPQAFLERGRVNSVYSNQALPAIMNRLLGPAPLIPGGPEGLAVLPPVVLTILRTAILLGGLAFLAYACRRRLDPARAPLAYSAEVSLVLIGTLALSGISWKAQFVALLLPYAVLLAYLADRRYADAGRRWVAAWLGVSFVLCTGTSDIITPAGANWAEALGLLMLGGLAAAAGVYLVRKSAVPQHGDGS